MDLPFLANGSASFLLLITYVFINSGSTQFILRRNSSTLNRTNITERSGWFHHKRLRREVDYDGRECIGNETVFPGLSDCYYDEEYCYEKIFGRQELLEAKTSMWKCFEYDISPFESRLSCELQKIPGFWMISKCPSDWFLDELRRKCENATSNFPGPVVEDYIPVVGVNTLTYRNQYCALCHGVKNYIAWDVWVATNDTRPEGYDLDSQLKSIHSWEWIDVFPGCEQPRRICFGRNYIDNCSLTNDTSLYKDCVVGPVEFFIEYVGVVPLYFKNKACATCNGYHSVIPFVHFRDIDCYDDDDDDDDDGDEDEDDDGDDAELPEPFLHVYKLRKVSGKQTAYTVVSEDCPSGTVYDTTLKFCREGYIISSSRKLTNEYLILLWFKPSRGRTIIISKLENDLKSALISAFSLEGNQMSRIVFHMQDMRNDLLVATFRLTLTPFQNLIMANKHKHFNVFLELLNFTGNFTLSWKENSFSVIKVISKQLSCYGEEKFQSHEYKIDEENGSFVANKTGKIFLLEDYTLVKEKGGNITLCRKLVLSDCTEGAYVPLSPSEYVIFSNLSVYHNATESIFKFGEYLIGENKGNNNISNTTQNSIFARKSTIAVCLPFKNTFNRIITKNSNSTSTTSYGLRILTLIGFIVSIVCLILLLITYGLFQELRTVPGINLMNLSLSMLLSHLIWLIGTSHFTGTTTCNIFAILEHYFFQVSFLAMSVISCHSYHVFSQPVVGRFANTWRRFIKYSAFVWLTPAIFVAICVTLDKTEAFPVDYGTNCWLGTVNAKLYLFILPLAVSLLYNIYTFIQTARSLSRHEKNRQTTLQRKEGKQNLLICTKLATLVGFPWLFAFVSVMFPDTEAFEYLFVVFVCLQGLYIGMAFLFNKKTLNLYKDRWNIGSRRNTAPTFEMT